MSQVESKPAPKSFARRDHLRDIEKSVQSKWEASKVNDVNMDPSREKFMVTFPYPYMNGRLHLGHAFSMTKAEFTARFQRLQGKNVLFPFGFHCTGMPIQAAANKLKEEIALYGCPPVFPQEVSTEKEEPEEEKSAEAAMAAKSKGKKTKLIVKGAAGSKPMRQWDILAKMVPLEEIPEFAEPLKWLNYFPPLGVSDLKAFGSAIDWRRSFITTSVNPVYDAFIRWQFNLLHRGNRIRSGFRPNVYSPKDKQVCADHDRSSGEGVGPQEYTIVKLLIVTPYPESSPLNHPALQGKNVYLAPATLRPETMYGQTNCFVLPEGEYGAYEWKNGDILIMSERAAIGLAHQDYAAEWGKTVCHVMLTGQDLLGLPLKAPNAAYEVVYTLPLMTISMGKGTGVVTSVPSDAPDDYVALKELKDKPLWREKLGLTTEMVEPFEVVPIIGKG
jgi:leucyl-tRNA synthetase